MLVTEGPPQVVAITKSNAAGEPVSKQPRVGIMDIDCILNPSGTNKETIPAKKVAGRRKAHHHRKPKNEVKN